MTGERKQTNNGGGLGKHKNQKPTPEYFTKKPPREEVAVFVVQRGSTGLIGKKRNHLTGTQGRRGGEPKSKTQPENLKWAQAHQEIFPTKERNTSQMTSRGGGRKKKVAEDAVRATRHSKRKPARPGKKEKEEVDAWPDRETYVISSKGAARTTINKWGGGRKRKLGRKKKKLFYPKKQVQP